MIPCRFATDVAARRCLGAEMAYKNRIKGIRYDFGDTNRWCLCFANYEVSYTIRSVYRATFAICPSSVLILLVIFLSSFFLVCGKNYYFA